MRASQNAQQTKSVFFSAKTVAAIPIAHDLSRIALIHASVDPAVRSIEFIPSVEAYGAVINLEAIVFRGEAGGQVLDIPELRPLRDIDDEGLALLVSDELGLSPLTLTAADLGREPRASNSALVWRYKHLPVSAQDRVRMLQMLGDDGPMQLGQLSAELRWSHDPVGAVLSMACSDRVELDLMSGHLGPETIVRRRMPEGANR
jgi:hypothetical protein